MIYRYTHFLLVALFFVSLFSTTDTVFALDTVTVTPHTTYGGTTGAAYYNESGATITWVSSSNIATCEVYRNGTLLASGLSYPGTSSYSVANITADVTYRVDCIVQVTTVTGNTVTFTVPPVPTVGVATCPAPGNNLTFNWNLPASYTQAYVRAYKTPPSSIDYPSACTPKQYAPDGVCTDAYTGTSYATSSTPGAEYYWYVHTATGDGNYSNSVGGGTITCGAPSCSAGQYYVIVAGVVTCTPCTSGNYCSGTSTPPVICPANSYCGPGTTPPGGTTPPTPCPAGYGSPAGSTVAGQCVLPTGYLTSTPSSCTIATGDSTCDTLLEWDTTTPVGTSSITTNTPPNTTVFTANTGNRLNHVPYNAGGSVMYYLYNNARELASTSVAVACAAGANKWDTIGGVCSNPQIDTALVTGNFYSNPAAIDLICTGSDGYIMYNSDSFTATSSGSSVASTFSVNVPIFTPGNYKVICKHGSVEDSQTLYYSYPPGLPTIAIDAYPKTITAGEKSVLSWNIHFPPLNACVLTAYPVCANSICSATQISAADTLNTTINSSSTDSNDPDTSRPIVTAVRDLAPGHDADYKALGRKTFTISKNTNFTIDCGSGYRATSRVRVVRNSDEQ